MMAFPADFEKQNFHGNKAALYFYFMFSCFLYGSKWRTFITTTITITTIQK
jgi:hypothetical protein